MIFKELEVAACADAIDKTLLEDTIVSIRRDKAAMPI
jgi:hypothetical protein